VEALTEFRLELSNILSFLIGGYGFGRKVARLLKNNSKNSRRWANDIFTSELLLDSAKKKSR